MTLTELARLAGVSVSTASKAFGNAPDISAETRRLVLDTARQYGCYGKFYKGKYSKKVIAVVCPETRSAYYANFLSCLQQKIHNMDGIMLISADEFDAAHQAELTEYYQSYLHVDGMVVFGMLAPLKKGFDVPVVVIGRATGSDADSVAIDLRTPMRTAQAELAARGHRAVAFIGEERTADKAQYFAELFQPDPSWVVCSPLRFEAAGADGVDRLLRIGAPVTALVCAYDYIAFGAVRRLNECGFRVPEDFSVIGMDNIRVAEYPDIDLASIDSHVEEVCEIVCGLLQKKLKNPYFRVRQQISVPGDFVLRGSVGTAKDGREELG